MQHTHLLLLFLFQLALAARPQLPSEDCISLATKIGRATRGPQLPTLKQLDVNNAEQLSSRGVFKIHDTDSGKYYVIRFHSKNDSTGTWRGEPLNVSHVPFEAFATKIGGLICHHTQIPPSERLPEKTSNELLKELSRNSNFNFDRNKVEGIASLTPFYDKPRVVDAFPSEMKNPFFQTFYTHLLDLASGYNEPNFRVTLLYWRQTWESDIAKEFRRTLEQIFPGKNFDTVESVEGLFFGHSPVIKNGAETIEKILRTFMGNSFLDAASEYWAIGNILGIEDSDSYNALWDGKSFVGIDLSYRTSRFLAGLPYPANGIQAVPINVNVDFRNTYSKDLGKLMMDRLSQPFIQKLSNLTEKKLLEIAQEAGFELSPLALRGMLSRIGHFKKRELEKDQEP